jgi:hypothetical protein
VLCSECGNVRPDPLMLGIFREQRKISQQQTTILEAIKRLEQDREEQPENGSARLLSPREMSERYGRKPQWYRDHAEELGGVRIGDGPKPPYFFDPERLSERLAARTNGAGKSDAKPKPPRRRRHRTASTELLPVKGRAA